jgi:hypothetical protein
MIAYFESPKHLHLTTFETLKYQQCFEIVYLGENVINLLKPKVAQNVASFLGCFMLSKNHNELQKVSPIGKKSPNLVTLLTHSVSKMGELTAPPM